MLFFLFDIMAAKGIVHAKMAMVRTALMLNVKKMRSLIFDLEGGYTSPFVPVLTWTMKFCDNALN
jgi:hypothetical protein